MNRRTKIEGKRELKELELVMLEAKINLQPFIDKYLKLLHKTYKVKGKQTFRVNVVRDLADDRIIHLQAVSTCIDGSISDIQDFLAFQ